MITLFLTGLSAGLFLSWYISGAFFSRHASRWYIVGTGMLAGATTVLAPWSQYPGWSITATAISWLFALIVTALASAAGKDS